MAETPSSIEGAVGFAVQSAKGTAATAFHMAKLTRFNWTPDVIADEGEPEIGGDLDIGKAERFGNRGATFEGEARFRPGNLGLVPRLYGMQHQSGGFIFWDGVNDQIRVTDDGGSATIDIITDGELVAGTAYTGAQVAAALKAALDADTTLTQTYAITYSESTKKFTIAHGGATLSLLWTTSEITQMMGNLLGFAHGEDDTGETSYTSDEERDATGRWSFRDGVNDTIRVTDDGGGPVDVDILSSTGYKLTERVPYNAWNVCGALKAVLDGDTTLTQTYVVTYSEATHKFTIAHGGTTLTIGWNHENSNLENDLGFDDGAADSGATTYTGDYTICPACRHYFTPYAASASFPWGSILDRFDAASTLDTVLRDCRVNNLSIGAEPDDAVRLTFGGRALYYSDPSGGETEDDDAAALGTPNTDDGSLTFGTTAGYPLAALTLESSWEEEVEPALCTGSPRSVLPRRRTTGGTAGVYLGAEDSAGVFRAAYYGATDGTAPSNTVVERALDVTFESGAPVSGAIAPGQASDTADYYALRFEAGECQMMTYEIEKSGDELVRGDLALHISRESTDWGITLVNDEDRSLYQ